MHTKSMRVIIKPKDQEKGNPSTPQGQYIARLDIFGAPVRGVIMVSYTGVLDEHAQRNVAGALALLKPLLNASAVLPSNAVDASENEALASKPESTNFPADDTQPETTFSSIDHADIEVGSMRIRRACDIFRDEVAEFASTGS
jgi:hypothetical protein